MIADVEGTAVEEVLFAITAVLVPNSYQPKQLKVAASHKAHATPVDGSLVGNAAPAAASFASERLLMTAAEAGATKLTQ